MPDDLDLARKKMAAGIEKAENPAPEPEPDESEASETIDIDADDDDEVEAKPAGPGRSEKKANRFRENNERASRAESEAADLRAQLAAERVAARQQPQQYQQQQPQPDRLVVERDALRREQEELSSNFSARQAQGQMSQDEYKRFSDRQHDITDRQARNVQLRIAAETPQVDPRVQHFRAVGQDVLTHEVASRWYGGAYQQRLAELVAQHGALTPQQDMDTAMEILEVTRKKFKLGAHRGGPAASERQQARYSGPSRSAPQSANTSGSERREVTITPEMRRTIDADPRYNKLDKATRYKTWAKNVGPTFLKMRTDTAK